MAHEKTQITESCGTPDRQPHLSGTDGTGSCSRTLSREKEMTGVVFIVFLLLATVISCPAGEAKTAGEPPPERLFSRGNDYYENAEYGKAIDEYEKILAGGYKSGALYYNLANAYFKAGKLGEAILNYERARYIMPRDADLIANYRFARSMVKGKVVPGKSIWAWRPLRIYSRSLTVNELTWLLSGIYILVLILLFISVVRPNTRRYQLIGVTLLLGFILFNSVVIRHKIENMRTGAVVIVPRAEALFGPFDSATKFFTLQEGMRVTVLKARNDWYKVRRADGKVGWIKANVVERI